MNKWLSMLLIVLMAAQSPSAQSQASLSTPTSMQSWNFRVYLDDKPIGFHRFDLRTEGEHRELHSAARFDVKVLFINAYKYVHDDNESWGGDCLQSMKASTDDNGKQLTMSAMSQGNQFNVIANARRYALPGCVMSFAYWNPLMLQQTHLLNAQTGEYDAVTIKLVGEVALQVRGVKQAARQYRLTGSKLSIDLWYSPSGEWLALESTTESGRRLRYLLT
jgi:hypothetical protein